MIGNASCFILFCCITLAALLEYIPKSRKIEVIDNDEYIFGFAPMDTPANLHSILYKSDNGIEGNFSVIKNTEGFENNKVDLIGREEITNLGNVGLAQLRVKYASDTGPKAWTLIAMLNDGTTLVDSDPVGFSVSFFYRASLLVDTFSVVEGASFLQYITLLNKQWKKCVLMFDDVEIDLNIESSESYTFLSSFQEHKDDVAKKVKSLGRGLCGFQLVNAIMTMSSSVGWALTATDSLGKQYRGVFKVVVYSKPNTTIIKKVIVGDQATLLCGVETTEQSYCSLYNPEGKLIVYGRTCSYTTNTVSISDIGDWKCVTGIRKSMETEDYTLRLINKGSEMVETWVKEYNKYVMLGCKLNGSPYETLTFCRMVAPNSKVFNLIPGGATARYVSLGTNFTESTCALEIEKPLQPDENGLWRCEMNAGGNDVTGGFLKVGDVKRPDYPKSLKITTQLKKPFTILCEVPYSSEYCHIRAPNGTIFQTESIYRTRLGRCSYTRKEATATDHGVWFCSFAQEMGTPDEDIAIEVIIAEVLVYNSEVSVRSGDIAELLCSSGGFPLNYCRFVSPSGKGYYIHNHQTSNTISYKGRGLEYGECGISINNIQTSENGIWACITRLGAHYTQPEITAHINLIVSPNYFEDPNIATVVGLSIGVIIISAVASIIGFRKWQQRRNNLQNSPQQRLINDGNSVTLGFPEATNAAVLNRAPVGHEHQT